MEKMTFYVLKEAIFDCQKRYRSMLPPDLQPLLDDLVELHDTLTICNSLERGDDKILIIYERAVLHLAETFMKELKRK
jgi:hypothetical protein